MKKEENIYSNDPEKTEFLTWLHNKMKEVFKTQLGNECSSIDWISGEDGPGFWSHCDGMVKVKMYVDRFAMEQANNIPAVKTYIEGNRWTFKADNNLPLDQDIPEDKLEDYEEWADSGWDVFIILGIALPQSGSTFQGERDKVLANFYFTDSMDWGAGIADVYMEDIKWNDKSKDNITKFLLKCKKFVNRIGY